MTQTSPTIKQPALPATEAQVSYLKALVEKHDLPAVCEKATLGMTLGFLTKGQASEFITALKAAPVKAAKPTAAPVAPKPLAETVAEIAASLTEAPAFGYYQIDGTLYYWDVTGKDAYPTLRRLQVVTAYDGKKKGSWKKVYSGQTAWIDGISTKAQAVTATFLPFAGKHWNYKTEVSKKILVPGVLIAAILGNGAKPLTQAESATLGKAFGFCIRCGATLTDPVSVANGIGPVCQTYWA